MIVASLVHVTCTKSNCPIYAVVRNVCNSRVTALIIIHPQQCVASSCVFVVSGVARPRDKMSTFTRYFLAACPLAPECTKTAWTRTKGCQAWTGPDECLEALRRHLKTSSLHFHHTSEEIEEAVLSSDILAEEVPSHWFEVPAEPSNKKQKQEQADLASHGGVENVARVAAFAAVHAVKAIEAPPLPPLLRHPQPSKATLKATPKFKTSGGSSSSSMRSEHILVSRDLLVHAHEAISKTSDTLKKAVTLFDGASTAFRLEQKRLDELDTLITSSLFVDA
jgi:hypothetical protein